MMRMCSLLACMLAISQFAIAQQVKAETNRGSFGPPPAALALTLQFVGTSSENTIDAGQKAAIKVTVTNSGGTAADQISVGVVSTPPLVGVNYPSTFAVGNIAAKTSKEAVIEFAAAESTKSQTVVLSLQASTPSGIKSEVRTMTVGVREKPRVPSLVVTAGFSEPSGNGMLDAGETGTVRATISNVGNGDSKNTLAVLRFLAESQKVSLTQPVSVGEIQPGKTATAVFEVTAGQDVPNQVLTLLVTVSASNGATAEPNTLSVTTKERLIVDSTPPEISIKQPVTMVTRGLKILGTGSEYRTEARTITIAGVATDSSGIRLVLVSGREAPLRDLRSSAEFSVEVPVIVGVNEFVVKAIDKAGNQNELALTVIGEENLVKGTNYALVIAVQDYQDPTVNGLQYPVQDARNFIEAITTQYTFDLKNVMLLKNPSRSEVIQAFDNLSTRLDREDNLLIFYAGHGYWDERLNQGFWLPSDARQSSRADWIPNGTIRDYIYAFKTKHTLLVSDACFSGGIFKTREAFSRESVSLRNLYKLPSRKAMTSGTMKEEVPDKSVFIEYLIKRLKENNDPMITGEDLFVRLRVAVLNNSPCIPQFGEIRDTGDEGGDFVFVRR